ncbi:MAG: fumarylacetoacetate hydrolase family protein [Marinicaulis sp.]|nr:fumarylacetoacetate hydrolase family protein [Marinicaulis sp.]
MDYEFEPPATPAVPVHGGSKFPVRRIFCVGKNYADHIREMGGDAKKSSPVFFTKPADAIVMTGASIPYPQGTDDLHYEGELVVAIGNSGRDLTERHEAGALIFGTACGCDLTRRDLQAAAKKAGAPWDASKAFDHSAPVAPIGRWQDFSPDAFDGARLVTKVNDEIRQDAPLSAMIWTVPEIICALSALFELRAGDLIYTGTPAGVGPLNRGDRVEVEIGTLPALEFSIAE